MVLVGVVKRGDRAEVALEIAAASEFHQRDVLIAFAGENLPPRADAAERPPAESAIDRLQPAMAGVVEQLRQIGSASPTTIASASCARLVGQQRHVVAAHDDRHAALAKLPGDLVGPQAP